MNNKLLNVLVIIFAITTLLLSIKIFSIPFNGGAGEISKNDSAQIVIQNILSRTSIRQYKEKDIEPNIIEDILHSAMAAPTAGNKQPWQIIMVNNEDLKNDISNKIPTAAMVKHAPMSIVVCGDTTATFTGEGNDFWIQDCSALSENILLSAHALGLGAVWCGIYPYKEKVAIMKSLLGVPEEIIPLCIIPLGYPNEFPEPKNKWKPQYVHQNHW